MSGLIEHVTRWENAQLEAIFNEDLRCEADNHQDEHIFHGGPATHLMRTPCGHGNGLRCSVFVESVRRLGGRCPICNRTDDPGVTVFIEV